jgi:predicted nucleotidyltransferase
MNGLDEDTENKIRAVFSRFEEIDKVVLYGSRAKGNYKIGSDIDLTFYGTNLKLKTIYKVHDALDNLYLPYKFDLSIFDDIENTELREHIRRVGKVFFEREKGME